jgi:hypothetical protein
MPALYVRTWEDYSRYQSAGISHLGESSSSTARSNLRLSTNSGNIISRWIIISIWQSATLSNFFELIGSTRQLQSKLKPKSIGCTQQIIDTQANWYIKFQGKEKEFVSRQKQAPWDGSVYKFWKPAATRFFLDQPEASMQAITVQVETNKAISSDAATHSKSTKSIVDWINLYLNRSRHI